jgi:ParB family chromosome partitioning protein
MSTQKYGPHLEHLHAVAGARSGRFIAVAGKRETDTPVDSQVHVYAKAKLDIVVSLPVGGSIAALEFAAGDLLIAAGDQGTLFGFDASSDAPTRVFEHALGSPEASSPIAALASDEDGKTLACVDEAGNLATFTVAAGGVTLIARRKLSARPLRAVAFDAASGKLAAAGDDSVVRVFADAKLGGEPREMPIGEGGVTALDFTGDGRVLVGLADGSIRVAYLEGAADEENRTNDDAHAGAIVGLKLGLQLHDEAGRELTRRMLSVGRDGVIKAWIHDTRRKPKTIELGSNLKIHAATWLRPYRAKDDAKGGTLLIVDAKRRLHLVKLDAEGSPSEDIDRIESHFAKLSNDFGVKKDEVRAAAIAELAQLPEDSARVLLDRALGNDQKPEIRKLAAEAMATGMRRRSRPALRTAVNDDSESVRKAAFAALETIEADTPLAPVRAALASKHADLRKLAVEKLPGLRAVSPLVPTLIAEKLRDGTDTVRMAALASLRVLEGARSRVPLRIAFEQGPPDIRIAALLGAYELEQTGDANDPSGRDPTGRDLLEDGLDDEHGEVRETAFVLAIATRPKLLGKLEGTFKTEIERLIKLGAKLNPSGGDPSEAELEPLFAAMASRRSDTALRGAKSLAVLGDSRSTGALLQLSREADVAIRRALVDALFIGVLALPDDDRLAARLQWLLDDGDASVRTAVFDALQMLASDRADAGALDLVELALAAASEDVRVRALQILVEFGGAGKRSGDAELAAKADRLLGDALDDEATKVRGEAFRTLWAWHSKAPQVPLTRGGRSRHGDVRTKVVEELDRLPDAWADELLIELVGDADVKVGSAAFEALTKSKTNKDRIARYKERAEVYLAAMNSPRPEVRALGAEGARKGPVDELRKRLIELLDDEHATVFEQAIESIDKLLPKDQHAWTQAFNSRFYSLRVKAAELCGKRRDDRAIPPMRALLTIPQSEPHVPAPALRQRAARAMADVGDRGSISFFVELLDDHDPIVREMGSRGLATACDVRDTQVLLSALSHGDLAVRSWIAEGLARLGDVRAVPVLVGTLAHEHRPIRLGAILSLAALGPDGSRGLLRGLEDRDREVQDLVFAIVVARDVARVRAGQPPDLLIAALASSQPEIRFVAARALEERLDGDKLLEFATELVGPPKPEKAADLKKWPEESERAARLRVIVDALASDDPSLRYAAARTLSLRSQAQAFWREAARLKGPKLEGTPTIPPTNWEDGEQRAERKTGWIRRLIGSARELAKTVKPELRPASRTVTELRARPAGEAPDLAEIRKLVFGTYAGLVRQAPAPGASDETHRVRRDSIERLGKLADAPEVGRDSLLPVLRRALSDPNHLVRRAAVVALRGLYPEAAVEPLGLAMQSSAADVGKAAIEELVQLALAGNRPAELVAQARAMSLAGVDAPNAEVRTHALLHIQKLFEPDSLEPWFVALGSSHADLRLSVVDRLVDARDERVSAALLRAMGSDHDDLRLKAAAALARRGDLRTVEVLAAFLRAEDQRIATRGVEALVSLALVRKADAQGNLVAIPDNRKAAAEAIVARLDDDPDRTADRGALIGALRRIGDVSAGPILLRFAADDDASLRVRAFEALVAIAGDETRPAQRLPNGVQRQRFQDALALEWLEAIALGSDASLRERTARLLRDVDGDKVEPLLARLLEDREELVRVAACEVLAFRAQWVPGSTLEPLAVAVKVGRRELVLPASEGLAARGQTEAFQPLILVLKAGSDAERQRAILALGSLGDRRALEELEPLLNPDIELPPEDRALAPQAVEALGAMLGQLSQLGDQDEHDRVRRLVERSAEQGEYTLRIGALAGLRRAGDDRSRALIAKIASERLEPDAVRRQAVVEIGELGREDSEAVLANLLSDANADLRSVARAALDRVFPTQRTRTALLALRSTYAEISGPAAGFLAKHGDPEVLVARMGEIAADDVRQQLRRGLVRRGQCPDSLAGLLRGSDAAARADAAWIAGAAGEAVRARLGDALIEAVRSSAKQWREAAERASRGSSDARLRDDAARAWRASLWAARTIGVDVLVEARAVLGTSVPEEPSLVTCEALRYLGSRGEASDVARIEPLLVHRDASIRTAAGAAVARLAGVGASEVLDRLAVADQVAVAPLVRASLLAGKGDALLETAERRRLALPVLLGDARFDALVGMAESAGRDAARLTAIASLGRLGTSRASAVLQGLLDRAGEDEAVRKAAYKALRRAQRGKTTTVKESQA